MKMLALGLTAFLVASPHQAAPPPAAPSEAAGETPFVASSQVFADEAACVAHLAAFVKSSAAYAAAVGPYPIAPGDTRAHRVKPEGFAHAIEEQRCLGAVLSSRRWTHGMVDVQPITMDEIDRMSFPAK